MLLCVGTAENYDLEYLSILEKYRDDLQSALAKKNLLKPAA
jgi:hypothetical protein